METKKQIEDYVKGIIKVLDFEMTKIQSMKQELLKEVKSQDSKMIILLNSFIDHSEEFIDNNEIQFFLEQSSSEFEGLSLMRMGRLMASAGFTKGKKDNKRGWYCSFDDSDIYAEK